MQAVRMDVLQHSAGTRCFLLITYCLGRESGLGAAVCASGRARVCRYRRGIQPWSFKWQSIQEPASSSKTYPDSASRCGHRRTIVKTRALKSPRSMAWMNWCYELGPFLASPYPQYRWWRIKFYSGGPSPTPFRLRITFAAGVNKRHTQPGLCVEGTVHFVTFWTAAALVPQVPFNTLTRWDTVSMHAGHLGNPGCASMRLPIYAYI